MDLNKSLEFFDPKKVKRKCHIIGCGAIGSTVAELLARQGVENFILWDEDKVESHNIVNQLYINNDIGNSKTKALSEILLNINPQIKIKEKPFYKNEMLNGYVFSCVDSIEIRKNIVKNNFKNNSIIALFDFRMTLLEGQHYAADWSNIKHKENLLKSMDFTDEEANENTPVTACGFQMSVAPTVRIISAYGVANFTNYVNNTPIKTFIQSDPYDFFTEAIG